jgi:hypothetical protein
VARLSHAPLHGKAIAPIELRARFIAVRQSMAAARIFQIFYNEATRGALDPGFIPLDNLANERPDWREYWPMRSFLLNEAMDENEFIGFFSPKFGQKTGLSAASVHAFVDAHANSADVVLFSPFFDQIALYWNIFEQGMNHHPGSFETYQQVTTLISPGIDLRAITTDSRNTVFSNFFVAKPRFWRAWLGANETIFALAERNDSPLAKQLNEVVKYGKESLPSKIFVMERMATLLLAIDRTWRVAVHDPMRTPLDNLFRSHGFHLLCMDALKIAATAGHSPHYREAYRTIREQISRDTKAAHEARVALKSKGHTR